MTKIQKIKTIALLALTPIFSLSVFAQQVKPEIQITSHTQFILDNKLDKNEKKQFDAQLIASTIDADMDAWHKMPKDAIAQLTSINKVRFGEKFSIFPLVRNATINKDGKFKIKYTISATAPDGKILTIVDSASYEGTKKTSHDILACPDVIDIKLDSQYQKGIYTFTIAVLDELAKKNVSNSTKVEIVDWIVPTQIDSTEILDKTFYTFHLKPSAELLYSMFFSTKLSLLKRNAPYQLNFMMLGFFKAGFLHYDFLIDEIVKNFANLKPDERSKAILLMRITGKKPINEKLLTQIEIKYQQNLQKTNIPNPYEHWDKVLAPAQIDMLWGEFYANGNYKPVRRIMNLLINSKEAKFVEQLIKQKRRPKTAKETNQFTMGMLHILSIKSLLRNANMCDRVDQYCVWAIENNDLPEESMHVIEPLLGNKPQSQLKKVLDTNFSKQRFKFNINK